jgi:hypothetical protein
MYVNVWRKCSIYKKFILKSLAKETAFWKAIVGAGGLSLHLQTFGD